MVTLNKKMKDLREQINTKTSQAKAFLADGGGAAFGGELHADAADEGFGGVLALVGHGGGDFVAEGADAVELDGASVLEVELHDAGQGEEHVVDVAGRGGGRVGDVLAEFHGADGGALGDGGDGPFFLALPAAFYLFYKCHIDNVLEMFPLFPSEVRDVAFSVRHYRVLSATLSRSQCDVIAFSVRHCRVLSATFFPSQCGCKGTTFCGHGQAFAKSFLSLHRRL